MISGTVITKLTGYLAHEKVTLFKDVGRKF
jgi:hypothetical protein